jgi:hypothetical protein
MLLPVPHRLAYDATVKLKRNLRGWFWVEDRAGYTVEAEVAEDEETGAPAVVGLSIRRQGDEPNLPVSLRDIRRLPLATILSRARAAASIVFDAKHRVAETGEDQELDMAELAARVRKARAPRGLPERGHSAAWYLELLQAERDLRASGVEHPGAELARRKKVPPNTVYQWLYRARKIEREGRGR